jgi:redox-sensitive bicupin YhaK (pirin superfamily)
VVAVTFAVDGGVEQTDSAGVRWQLRQGDAGFSIGGGGVMQGATRNDQGVKLLHLWINLPNTLKLGSAAHQVIRHEDARRASFGDASALLYAGTLGSSSGPYASPWPITVADLSLQAGKKASLPLASNERCFAYILSGDVELGRNQVQLNRGSVAWIERTVEPVTISLLSLRAAKETRVLLFSSPVFAEDSPTLTTEPVPRRSRRPHMTNEART